MYARTVDDAAEQLLELKRAQRDDLGLAGVAFVLSVAAAMAAPGWALPLFLGGLAGAVLGTRAVWRHWDLLERLAGDRDAYTIAEVRTYASRHTTRASRGRFASHIRCRLEDAGAFGGDPTVRAELEALARELEDDALVLDTACAVACMRLVTDPTDSPFLSPSGATDELLRRIGRIRAGFSPAQA